MIRKNGMRAKSFGGNRLNTRKAKYSFSSRSRIRMHAVPSVHHIVAHAAGADVAKKAAACVTGAYVADAASLGLHWVYNVKEIATAVGSDAPEFHELAAPWHAGKRVSFMSFSIGRALGGQHTCNIDSKPIVLVQQMLNQLVAA